ncbi:diphosphomevalonate decarboxylase [Schizosaccharomyces cryophilus OY26]|uniref:Diphosphomevalonate decarboxylase n=1 Tax=Schizosaccharomyces cryophilus (strain OY26 / ATCC MYA-4695 / CBS 11777 / NBRC 106824 / NRRL Y48691) TaxID=653667 RepID=S9W4B2_SCHCR|nr:diphosphomevalonate decarboxylase [Schizosaccharomyces cryophilus OY26]EPY53329.1 diphosphomevalonate decarboxylase [Schizosaccharomyces cryophilus OY26]
MAEKVYQCTVSAPVNIAVIKYWGKRDVGLNLPTNSSLSVTLSQDDLRTVTTASCSKSFEKDTLWLNGHVEDISTSKRLSVCVEELRSARQGLEKEDDSLDKISQLKLHVVSKNNFPTAAGLASSAAGYAAFTEAVARLYGLPWTPTQLSRIARQGSGSACRSLFGGYVAWEMGELHSGADSVAVQVEPVEHWPEMRVAIMVASAAKKGVSSTSGMQSTVASSTLFQKRVKNIVPERMQAMKQAIRKHDFETFAKLTMTDSNQFHACCLDTFPPIFYLNDTSRAIIRVVENINAAAGKTVAAYTFDAGPNAVVYFLEENSAYVLDTLYAVSRNAQGWEDSERNPTSVKIDDVASETVLSGVSRVILTKVGDGPRLLSSEESLINEDGTLKDA